MARERFCLQTDPVGEHAAHGDVVLRSAVAGLWPLHQWESVTYVDSEESHALSGDEPLGALLTTAGAENCHLHSNLLGG